MSQPETEVEQTSAAVYLDEISQDTELSDMLATLPHWAARGLLYIVISLVTVGLLFTYSSEIDIIRGERATIIPEGRTLPIQPPVNGILREILVTEGESVEEGQPLAVVESREVTSFIVALHSAELDVQAAQQELDEMLPLKKAQTNEQISGLRQKLSRLAEVDVLLSRRVKQLEESLRLSEETYELELDKFEETLKRIDVELSNAEATHELWQTELAAMSELLERSAASQLQYLTTKRSTEEASGEIQKLKSVRRETEKEQAILDKKHAETKSTFEASVDDIRERVVQNEILVESTTLDLEQLVSNQKIVRMEAEQQLERSQLAREQAEEALQGNFPNLRIADLASIEIDASSSSQTVFAPSGRRGCDAHRMLRCILVKRKCAIPCPLGVAFRFSRPLGETSTKPARNNTSTTSQRASQVHTRWRFVLV